MKIILKENVEGLGARGAIVNVKDGYARNYLLPKGIAMRYTPGAQKVLQQERRMYETKQLQAKEEAQELAEKISSLDLSVAKRAGDQDVLYGSVTVTDLAEMIKQKGIIVDKRKLILNEPIKRLGDYEIGVKLHQEVIPTVRLHVVKEE
jgi:large subunit ribosomal protein L9